MREQKLQLISADSLYERSLMNYSKRCYYEGLSFICSNLQDACSVEFTNHPSKRQHWQRHFFISEVKSSNILSMPKATASTFGLPPQIYFITWKCWYNILWLPLLVPNTISLDYPLVPNSKGAVGGWVGVAGGGGWKDCQNLIIFLC